MKFKATEFIREERIAVIGLIVLLFSGCASMPAGSSSVASVVIKNASLEDAREVAVRVFEDDQVEGDGITLVL
jgi:hypothetical protein